MPFTPEHILITGAGGAIGGALAETFARRYPDARQTLVDRHADSVQQHADALQAQTAVEVCDLTDIEALPDWWRTLTKRRGDVDLLVNCAGIMEIVSFTGTDWELGRRVLNINLTAPLRLMNLAVPAMRAAGRGGVINITSMAGRMPFRGFTYYGAAKAGMGNASECARLDLENDGIDVLTVYPGPIHSHLESRGRGQVRQGLITRWLPTGEPDAIAARILKGFERGAARVIYPDVYGAASQVANLAATSWLMARLSPQPNQ